MLWEFSVDISVDKDDFASRLAETKVFGLVDSQHTKSVKVGEFGNLVTGDST